MPELTPTQRALRDKRQGKSPSTQAGEFVREEIDLIRQGVHGARNTKQAIAIGLSKARRAGVQLAPPKKGKTSEATRRKAARDVEKGSARGKRVSPKRSRATLEALKREGRSPASKSALAKQARSVSRSRTAAEKSASAKRAAQTRARRRQRDSASPG
jgi:hypothetical protein